MTITTKDLLNQYKDKNLIVLSDDKINYYYDNKQKIKAEWKTNKDKYLYSVYQENLVLWNTPLDVLPIEFELSRQENIQAIKETITNLDRLKFQYCVCDHQGKSPYIWIFNIKNIPLDKTKNKEAKKLLAYEVVPSKYHKSSILDHSNFGNGLTPIINHKHWKTKYNGNKHLIISGINPLKQVNEYPKYLLNKLNFESAFNTCGDDLISLLLKGDTSISELYNSVYPKGYRSEKEFSLVLLLVSHNLNDFQINEVMNSSFLGTKWRSETEAYKKRTIANARKNCNSPRTLNLNCVG